MIKGIIGGPYIDVIGGVAASTYIPNNPNASMVGQLRYNPVSHQMEIYDGSNWVLMQTTYPEIKLSSEAISLLDWARAKRSEDTANRQLANSHPAVKAAMDNLEKAKRDLDITVILSKDTE